MAGVWLGRLGPVGRGMMRGVISRTGGLRRQHWSCVLECLELLLAKGPKALIHDWRTVWARLKGLSQGSGMVKRECAERVPGTAECEQTIKEQ